MAPKKTSTPMTDAAIKQLIAQGVADALTEYEATRNSGAEGVIGLTQWFEKMKSVFYVRNCTVACQIKFATCTLLGSALTWWNSHVKTFGHDAAYEMTWKILRKMMTDKYCPRIEIKKVEMEIWNLKVKGTDVYVGGLPDMIQGSVMASKPKTMKDAVEFANYLAYQKIRTFAERQVEDKRKLDDNSRNNHTQQQPHKRRNIVICEKSHTFCISKVTLK
ncbi:reverse transcriptase domain-containing protein [Tanacetum coccineum]